LRYCAACFACSHSTLAAACRLGCQWTACVHCRRCLCQSCHLLVAVRLQSAADMIGSMLTPARIVSGLEVSQTVENCLLCIACRVMSMQRLCGAACEACERKQLALQITCIVCWCSWPRSLFPVSALGSFAHCQHLNEARLATRMHCIAWCCELAGAADCFSTCPEPC
jgi:hypothetical protein